MASKQELGISISRWQWRNLILELRRRGHNRRESGAFLLAPQDREDGRVTAFICYDDLDPQAYQGGAIAFHDVGHAALWDVCTKRRLRVVGDIHTHPGSWVSQSSIDQHNPMMPLRGHIALIVPNYANTSWWTLDTAGIYVYLGDFKWRSHAPGDRARPLKLTLL